MQIMPVFCCKIKYSQLLGETHACSQSTARTGTFEGSPGGPLVKNLPASAGAQVAPQAREGRAYREAAKPMYRSC